MILCGQIAHLIHYRRNVEASCSSDTANGWRAKGGRKRVGPRFLSLIVATELWQGGAGNRCRYGARAVAGG